MTHTGTRRAAYGGMALACLFSSSSLAQTPAPAAGTPPRLQDRVEVVATRVPEPPDVVPAPVEVFLGSALIDRGARDLASALALASGVTVAPGGDGGPASSVPEFWGLKEFDAFLLVVDGVPWGGAFNPALATISLDDVERIEVMRGPAPTTYGPTSFVGVIHVVHKSSGAGRTVSLRAGSFQSAGATIVLPLSVGRWNSRFSAGVDRQGYPDDRTSFRRGHALWSNNTPWQSGRFWLNVDAAWLDQDPASPHPREGRSLTAAVPLDANHNPAGAFLNDTRVTLLTGFERKVRSAAWLLSASLSRSAQEQFRGFLRSVTEAPDNATGLRETIDQTDVYVDSHMVWEPTRTTRFLAGADYVFGGGTAHGATFDYEAPLRGAFAPAVSEPTDLPIRIMDRRQFVGAYSMLTWRPTARVRVDGGLRLNITNEVREQGTGSTVERERESGATHVRPSGSAGAIVTAWSRQNDFVRLYANYRNTFKPAAFDFGLGEAEGDEEGLLKPETAHSVEGGVKSRWLDGQLTADASAFLMHFDNLVIAQAINGLPALANAGTERFRGLEAALAAFFKRHVTGRVTYSLHDAAFSDYLTEFDGVPTQLAGKRLEMSARHLASASVLLAPPKGALAGVELGYVGSRYLNKRNTALADGYATLSVLCGYRFPGWALRLDARNLTDERPPVAESELGDAQYYRLPSRRIDLTFTKYF
jgi:iron complex outermembrane receptor protein